MGVAELGDRDGAARGGGAGMSGANDMSGGTGEGIEAYLDDLMLASRTLPTREARHLIAETEAHLRDAVEAKIASGVDEPQAIRDALSDFGTVDDLVAGERSRVRTPVRVLASQVVHSAVVLGSIGAVAVGLTGVVAGLIYLAGGVGAVASRPTSLDLTASNCARWLAHGGHDCSSAAMADWAAEIVWYRIAVGVLGAAVLAGYWALARRRGWRRGLSPLVSDSIATTLFVCACVGTAGLTIDSFAVDSGRGMGQWLSVVPVAAGAAWVFGRRVAGRLREPALG